MHWAACPTPQECKPIMNGPCGLSQAALTSNQHLTCPFCGGKDIRSHHRGHPSSGEWVIECHGCSCELTGFDSQQEAWDSWNIRPSAPETSEAPTIKDEILESFRSHIALDRPLAVNPPNELVQVPLRWLAIAAAEMAGMKYELTGEGSSVETSEPYHGIGCAKHRGGACNCAASEKAPVDTMLLFEGLQGIIRKWNGVRNNEAQTLLSDLRAFMHAAHLPEKAPMNLGGIPFVIVEDPTMPPDQIELRSRNGQVVRVIGLRRDSLR